MKLSVIIVNYNSGALTAACLKSIMPQLPSSSEIIIVDNDSSDDSVPFLRSDFPEITLIANEKNVGLAAGVNQAIAKATGDYYLLLNPDIIATENAVPNLLSYIEANPKVGLAGGKLISPNGKLQDSAYRFYNPMTILYRRTPLGKTPWGKKAIDHFLLRDINLDVARDVDWLMGSCYLMRAPAIAEVGGMDELFFLYFEDVDWCRRFWEKDWEVHYVPAAVFSHFHQQQSRRNPILGLIKNWTTREHIRSAIKYFRKYANKKLPHVTK